MKIVLTSGYALRTASSPAALDLSGAPLATPTSLLAVINATHPGVLFAAGKPGYGGTWTGAVLALQASVAGMLTTDQLVMICDDGTVGARDATVSSAAAQAHADATALLTIAETLATDRSVQAVADDLSNFATANHGDLAGISSKVALDASLQQILAVLQAQRADTLWTDDSGAYYVRVDDRGTITWVDISGNSASAPGVGARPAAGATVLLDKSSYQAIAAGTGYAIGDLLDHIVTTDPSTGALIGHFWLNTTAETKISAPSAAAIEPLSRLPDNAATLTSQTTGNASLATLVANSPTLGPKVSTGAVPVVVASDQTVPVATKSNPLRVKTTGALGAVNAAVTLAVDGMATAIVQLTGTWVGTVTWLASIDDGASYIPVNLKPRVTAGGVSVPSATANGVWEWGCAGATHLQVVMTAYTSGSATALLAAASASKLVRVEAPATDPLPTYLTAGSAIIGAVTQSGGPWSVSGTVAAAQSGAWTVALGAGSAAIGSVTISNFPAIQPVSAATLPLPTGAATDTTAQTGNTNTSAIATATGTTADAATASGANTSIVGALRAIRDRLLGTLPVSIAAIVTTQGFYSNALQSLSTGAPSPYYLDKRANLKTSETGSDDPLVGITPAITQSGTSLQAKATQGNLYGVSAVNTSAVAGYLVVINAASVPASGTAITPQDAVPLPANGAASISYGAGPPDAYAAGIVVLVSTSLTTYTPSTLAAFIRARAR